MAAKKKSSPKSSDGLKLIGREDGKLKYEATLRKKHEGKLIVDTTAVILADNKAEALLEKARRLETLVQEKLGTKLGTRKRFGVAIDEWLETLRVGTRKPYSSHIRKFRALGEERFVDQVAAQELQRVIATLTVGDKTASQVRVAVTAFFGWAKSMGYTPQNTARETEPRKRTKTNKELLAEQELEPPPKDMTAEELNRFLLALRDESQDYYALAGTQFLLGCRFGEVSALRWQDIDSQGVVHVRVAQYIGELGPTKSKKKRKAALGPAWLAVLQEHRERMIRLERPEADVWCFPAPGNRSRRGNVFFVYETIRKAYHRAFKRTGVELGAVTHALRHTMVTLAQVEGMSLATQYLTGARPQASGLQSFVGHATPEMTQRYTHVPNANLIDFAAEFEKRVGTREGGGKGGGTASGSTRKP